MQPYEIAILIIAALTLLFSILGFVAKISVVWFKRKLPVEFGFLLNNRTMDALKLSSGDEAKRITFRFRNKSKITLTDLVIELKFKRPIALSGTKSALTAIANKVVHGDYPEGRYYFIRHFDLEIPGENQLDFIVELNTKVTPIGDHEIDITCYSKTQNFNYNRKTVNVNIS